MFDIELEIGKWRDYLRLRGNITVSDVEELETHLRDELDDLRLKGLSEDEAFLVAVKRIGKVDALSREFAKVNSTHLWRQLMFDPVDPVSRAKRRKEVGIVIMLSVLAGSFAKLPELFGIHLFGGDGLFYFRNGGFFLLPLLGFYLYWRRGECWREMMGAIGLFVASAVLINMIAPGRPHTGALSAMHLFILLWLVVCLAYAGRDWKTSTARMNFVRFSGELFIYTVLILWGGIVLMMLTRMIFSAISINPTIAIREYIAIYGGLAAPIVAAYLVEEKKSIIENLAPVLARIFAPIFLLLLLTFLIAMAVLGKGPLMAREYLIGFDLMLALVLGLVLYNLSARPKEDEPGLFDYINFGLILVALAVDAVALHAIIVRIDTFGFTANKTAALGENIVLLINLAVLAVLYLRYLSGKTHFGKLLDWQTAYLPVIGAWAATVAFLFPLLFETARIG